MSKPLFHIVLLPLIFMLLAPPVQAEYRLREIATIGSIPWGLAFIEKDTLLFTRREGKAGLVNVATGQVRQLTGIPPVYAEGQGGLLDVAVPPDFQREGWIYFTYSKPVDGEGATTLARARLQQDRLTDWTELLVTDSATDTGYHFGSRIAFDDQDFVYFGIGDRGERPNSQQRSNHAGSIIRLYRDGRVPADNPFVGQADIHPEIWSYGHRNPQGLAFDPVHKRLWEIEHGPRGGDEINRIEKGKNYGWPIISYGKEYWGPIDVGEDTHRDGMEQPVKYYVPSIAPGSLIVYRGDIFPDWNGALMSGALKLRHINIVTLDELGRETGEQRILEELGARIRSLAQDKAGYLYFATDSGKLYVLEPEDH